MTIYFILGFIFGAIGLIAILINLIAVLIGYDIDKEVERKIAGAIIGWGLCLVSIVIFIVINSAIVRELIR